MARAAGLLRLLVFLVAISGGYLALSPAPRSSVFPDGNPSANPTASRSIEGEWDTGTRTTGAPESPITSALTAASRPSGERPGVSPTGTLAAPSPPSPGSVSAAGTLAPPRKATPAPEKPAATPRKVRKAVVVPKPMARYGVPWLAKSGIASHMGSGFPASYLALPHGPGWHVRICGAGGCVVMWSNDAGPDLATQRKGRIADLSVQTFEAVCGVPASRGLCRVSVTVIGHR